MGRAGLGEPQRPAFHHLITLSSSTLWSTVDFTGYALKPGSWLWVRPGQVQQWGDLREAEGTLILFERDFLDPGTVAAARVDDPHAPVLQVPGTEDRHALEMAVNHLALESQALHGIALGAHVAVHALGYSPRTLSRATLAGAGVGAKEFIDRRVILEAERLLAHGDQSASRIAAQLGFTSATNFSKYFQQRTGQSPIAFRARVRGRSSESGRGDVPGPG